MRTIPGGAEAKTFKLPTCVLLWEEVVPLPLEIKQAIASVADVFEARDSSREIKQFSYSGRWPDFPEAWEMALERFSHAFREQFRDSRVWLDRGELRAITFRHILWDFKSRCKARFARLLGLPIDWAKFPGINEKAFVVDLWAVHESLEKAAPPPKSSPR